MRVGLITTSFPRFEGDVAGSFVLGFAQALACRGHEIEVLAPEPATDMQPPQWPSIRVQWIPYLRPRTLSRTFYGSGVPDNLVRDPLAWMGVAPFVVQLMRHAARRAKNWQAVVSHWALPSALIANWACPQTPHLAVFHSADVHLLRGLPRH